MKCDFYSLLLGFVLLFFANAEETTAPITPDDTIRTESITDSTVNSNSNQTTTLKSPPRIGDHANNKHVQF